MKLIDNATRLQLASCCTFYPFDNQETNNFKIGKILTTFSLFDKTSSKICYICINFQPFYTKEKSQTRAIEKDIIKLYAINSPEFLR